MMCAAVTPRSSAWIAHSSFGIIPPLTVPSAIERRTPAASICWISFWLASSTPVTSVSRISFSAESASAIAPAAVSAFTLCVAPSASTPTGATTGMKPSLVSVRISETSTRCGLPTRPRSRPPGPSSFDTRRKPPASLPVRPIAWPPA